MIVTSNGRQQHTASRYMKNKGHMTQQKNHNNLLVTNTKDMNLQFI